MFSIKLIFTLLLVYSAFAELCERAADYVIVGAGVGGCTVAGRLSENGNFSVLLLEAGGFPDPRWDNPILSSKLLFEKHENIGVYVSVKQENAGLLKHGYMTIYRGVGLGGGSTINTMIFNRGSPHDFNNWASIVKDNAWNYTNMLPYFKQLEDYHGNRRSSQRGTGGPITVSTPKWGPGVERFLAAGQSLGYPVADPNGPQVVSFAKLDFSLENGHRVSAYTGHIKPFLGNRKNLNVVVNAYVSRILLNGTRAIGVVYTTETKYGKKECIIKANKEVIISAGFAETPALLMKSGIGPKSVLAAANIPVIKELPVGENLQDHLSVRMNIVMNKSEEVFLDSDLTPAAFQLWNQTGEGPYATWRGQPTQAFVQTSFSKEKPDWADIQIVAHNSQKNVRYTLPSTFKLQPGEVFNTVAVVLGRPKSHGVVTLNVTNVDSPPLLDFKFFTSTPDLDVMVEGIKTMLRIYENTSEYQQVGARLPDQPLEVCKHLPFRSDEYWKCVIKQTSASADLACCTCKMGTGSDDLTAVVDSKMRVIGIDGLRVVDASVMPTLPNANLQAVIYGIAEKAANYILESY